MARLFSIYFHFDGVLHGAIVSVRSNAFYTEYLLGNLDAALLTLLPGNKIISQQPGQFFFPNASPQHSVRLMTAIIQSIRQHLHAENDVASPA